MIGARERVDNAKMSVKPSCAAVGELGRVRVGVSEGRKLDSL